MERGTPDGSTATGVEGTGAGQPVPTGERAPVRTYDYRPSRFDRRQVTSVGLAIVLVLGMSLAIVAFTRGDSGSPTATADTAATTTSPPPPDDTPTSTTPAGGGPSPGPSDPAPPATTAPPAEDGAAGDATEPQGSPDDEAGTGPEITRFGVVNQGLGSPCGAYQRRITLAWESAEGTSARLDGPGAPTEPLPASGQVTACRDAGPPETYTLTVTGPDGTTFRTTTV